MGTQDLQYIFAKMKAIDNFEQKRNFLVLIFFVKCSAFFVAEGDIASKIDRSKFVLKDSKRQETAGNDIMYCF